MTPQAMAPRPAARDDDARPASGETSELDMLLELVDGLAGDLPVQHSPGAFAFPLPTDLSPSKPVAGLTPAKTKDAKAADTKREKSREKERRKYYRKKDRLAGLQQQAAALERQLRSLTAAPSDAASSSSPSSSPASKTQANAANPDREKLQLLMADLTQTKTQLRIENTQLRRQFRESAQRMAFVTDLLYSEHKLYSAHASYFRLLKPLTMQSCDELHTQAVETVSAFSRSTFGSPVVGSVSGWRERRVVDGPLFKFALEKAFPRVSAKFASSQAWAVLLDPSRSQRLYSDVLDVRVRFVQKIDDDNFVFLEEMRTMDPDADNISGGMVKSAVLASRVQIENGFRIHMRALDRHQIEMEDLLEPDDATGRKVGLPRDQWNAGEQLTWLQFEERDGACVVSFAGMTPTIGANAYFWMAEVVLLCLRCESAVLGPRFSLPK